MSDNSKAIKRLNAVVNQTVASSRQTHTKAVVCGAAGGIGQTLSLLLKLDPNIDSLALYDVAPTILGVAADIGHVNSHCQCLGGFNKDGIDQALKDAKLVVVPAGVPRKPGMTRDDLFKINASINADLAIACAKNCPDAIFCIISNPVNSVVPVWAETLKKAGCYNPKRLFGVTTLDVVRANTFVSEKTGTDVKSLNVNVIGGHAGHTILPLLSGVPNASFTQGELEALTHRIQFGGDEVVKAKNGAGSATLSMAYAGAEFTSIIARVLKGEQGLKTCSYVQSSLVPGCDFFSSEVSLTTDGVGEIHPFKLSDFEKQGMEKMLPELKGQIKKGQEFGKSYDPAAAKAAAAKK